MRPVLLIQTLTLVFCLSATIALAKSGAKPVDKRPVTISYQIYAGGIHALSANLKIDRSPKDYAVKLTAKPYGVIGNLLPWGGIYDTKGTVTKDIYQPNSFKKISQWREDNDSDSFVYKKGVLISQTETDETKKPAITKNIPIDPKLTENTVDILTGTVRLLQQLDAGKSCNFSTTIYDGRRRYTLKFTDEGSEELKTSDYNSYSGPAKICEIEMIPIAGFPQKPKGYYKIQEEARAKGQLPRVWLGRVFSFAGQDGPYVPVKLLVKSEYGAVLIHLQKVIR